MDAGPNLDAIQGAKARTEEAAAATAALGSAIAEAAESVLQLLNDLKDTALTAMSATEIAHQSAAGAREATEEHLNSTPSDHTTVPAIITAKGACETATMGLGSAADITTGIPGRIEELTNDYTTALGVLASSALEEVQGIINQALGEIGTAETNISSVKG